jgi:hypothetical protein
MVANNLKRIIWGFFFFGGCFSLAVLVIAAILSFQEPTSVSKKASEYKYLFLYSHPFMGRTYIVATNDGQSFEKVTYSFSDTPYLIKDTNNNLILPAEHMSKYYTIDDDFHKTEHALAAPYTFMIRDKHIRIESLNTSLQENTLYITDSIFGTQSSIRLPSYLSSATYDESRIYVLNYNAEKEVNEVHVINRKDGNVIRSYQVKDGATEMLKVHDYLLLNTDGSLTRIHADTGEISHIAYPDEAAEADKIFLVDPNTIYITYITSSGNTGLFVLDDQFSIKKNVTFEVPYMTAQMKHGRLYVLSQTENHPQI